MWVLAGFFLLCALWAVCTWVALYLVYKFFLLLWPKTMSDEYPVAWQVLLAVGEIATGFCVVCLVIAVLIVVYDCVWGVLL